jgi:hypothetical protein
MYRRIFVIMLIVNLAIAISWIAWSINRSISIPIVRKVKGLPSLFKLWDVYEQEGMLFALCEPDGGSYQIYRIDPATDTVIEEIEVKQLIHPLAVIARHYHLPDAWLAEMGFWAWEIDPQKKVAYAIKFELTKPEESFGIYVIDTETKVIKKVIKTFPFLSFILHPSGRKLYVDSPPDSVGVLDTEKLEWIKKIEVAGGDFGLSFHGFSSDGRYLLVATTELIAINAEEDKIEEWGKRINEELDTKYDASVTGLAFSEDELEIYAALAIGSYIDIPDTPVDLFNEPGKKAHGGVAAIDLAQKKIVRILGLTQKGECNSVAVIGNKLFVASWEGVFVIDIDRWRQQ